MAKYNKTVSYTKAEIMKDQGIIVEHLKDEDRVYSIEKILDEWDGITGISLTIKKEEELPEDGVPAENFAAN